jgi:hypothetical protein
MQKVSGIQVPVEHAPVRPGDVRDSLADISAAALAFGYKPAVSLDDGLREYMAWAKGDLVGSLASAMPDVASGHGTTELPGGWIRAGSTPI